MKCQKCGNEITSSDKYCNNCGAKVKKPAVYYCPGCKKEFDERLNFCNVCGEKLKIKPETISCPRCGKTIPKNSAYCSFCYKELNSDIPVSSNKNGTDKPIYKTMRFRVTAICLSILVFFFTMMIIVGSCSTKSTSKTTEKYTKPTETVTTEQPTTTGNYTEAEKDTDFTLEDMTFTIPKNWKYEYHKENDWVELKGPNGGNVQISVENEDLEDSVADLHQFIDDIKNSDITVYDTEETDREVGGENSTFILYTVKLGSIITYNYVYVVQYDDNTYTLHNSYYGEEAIDDNSVFIGDIVNSVKFKSSGKKSPTKKPTEPPTEKPTDITEPMTLLFSDSELSVYYSDTEVSKYFDDRSDVHLFVENNMNKSITIQADTVVLDGISYNSVICSDPISANSRGMIEITVRDCNVKSPKTVGADLRYFNSDFSGDVIKLNIVSQSVK